MSDINFLENQKRDESAKRESKKENFAWSDPKKESVAPAKNFFSFLPFIGKKPLSAKSAFLPVDKSKIKKSREETLNLIKSSQAAEHGANGEKKSFFSNVPEIFKKQNEFKKDVLVDYQRVFNSEKENKNKIRAMPDAGPEAARGNSGFVKWLKKKIISLNEKKREAAKIIKSVNPADSEILSRGKQTDPEKTRTEEKIAISPEEPAQSVLETNLIRGEIVTFFDWRSKIAVLISAIFMPIFLIAAVYSGLALHKKSSREKNLAQAEKFAGLERAVAQEEASLKEISSFQTQLGIVSKVFDQHIYWTNFFNFLEDNTIKNVYFTGFEGDTSGNYVMDALASDYASISEQVKVFKNNEKVTFVEASGGQTVAGDGTNKTMVKFSLKFSIPKSVFTE